MWVYCSGVDGPSNSEVPNIVVFDYQSSRHGYHAANYLQDFSGYFHVDGYAAMRNYPRCSWLVGHMRGANSKKHRPHKAAKKWVKKIGLLTILKNFIG
jgi:hypothetical protein